MKFTEREKSKSGAVILSKILLILGIILTITILMPGIVLFIKYGSISALIGFSLFALLPLSMVIGYFNCRIYYNEDGFVYKNFIGIKKEYAYTDITAIRTERHGKIIYIGEKHISIDEFAVGCTDFIKFANKKYNQLCGENIQRLSAPPKDIFNGNLKNPGDFKALFIILYSIVAIFAVFMSVILFVVDDEPRKMYYDILLSCDYVDENLEMQSVSGERYVIRNVPQSYDTGKIRNICDGKTQVKIGAYLQTPEDGAPFYTVRYIQINDKTVLSMDETDEFEKIPKLCFFALIVGGYLGLITFLMVFLIFAGRNAKKYPKLARIAFQKSELVGFEVKHKHSKKSKKKHTRKKS